ADVAGTDETVDDRRHRCRRQPERAGERAGCVVAPTDQADRDEIRPVQPQQIGCRAVDQVARLLEGGDGFLDLRDERCPLALLAHIVRTSYCMNIEVVHPGRDTMTDDLTLPRWLKPASRVNLWLLRLGLPIGTQHILTVPGRTSGLMRSTPVSVLTVDGARYIVSAPSLQW